LAFTTRDGKTQSELSEINMIPFIDIMLVLLIIFIVTAPVIQSGIDINVPRTEVVREIAEEKLIVSVDREQNLFLQDEAVNINDLGRLINERIPDPERRSIYLRADESVPFGTIAVVMDRLTQAGIDNISVVTQPLNVN
jgi:biopolymer transport protein ExbD/biopolymer transport protein TolR